MNATIAALYRHPVKGLTPERIAAVRLAAGDYFPGDRLFAVENGPAGFDAAAPQHQPKIKFLMLMRNERLATLRTRYLDSSGELVIEKDGAEAARGDLTTPEGRATIEAFFAAFSRDELRGEAKVLAAPQGFRFTDSRVGYVSLINRASIADLGAKMGRQVDPLRLRGNVWLDGMAAWSEFDLMGKRIRLGSATLEVTNRIRRCAATNVDPATGIRDMNLPQALERLYGHTDCGIYAKVIAGGDAREGDALELEQGELV